MRRFMIIGSAALGAVAAAALLMGGAVAEHSVSVQVRPLPNKTCVAAVEAAVKTQSARYKIDAGTGKVLVGVPSTTSVNVTKIIESLRAKGYEPKSLMMNLSLDAVVTIKSGNFGITSSKKELEEALGELDFLDMQSHKFQGNALRIPVAGNGKNVMLDVVKVIRAAEGAGFAVASIEVQGTPGKGGEVLAKAEAKIDPSFAKISFKNDIQPILARSCYGCHGADTKKRKADINWQNGYDEVKEYVTPGDPEESSLYNVLTGEGARQMPPNNRLPADVILTVRKWIKAGAKNN